MVSSVGVVNSGSEMDKLGTAMVDCGNNGEMLEGSDPFRVPAARPSVKRLRGCSGSEERGQLSFLFRVCRIRAGAGPRHERSAPRLQLLLEVEEALHAPHLRPSQRYSLLVLAVEFSAEEREAHIGGLWPLSPQRRRRRRDCSCEPRETVALRATGASTHSDCHFATVQNLPIRRPQPLRVWRQV